MDPTDLVSTQEAADILGKSVATVNRLAANGSLVEAAKAPGLRGARLYRRSDVEALLSSTDEAVA